MFNSSGVIGQILIGHLSDRWPYPWIMFSSALGSAISAFLIWGFADTLTRVFAFAIIFGGLVSVLYQKPRIKLNTITEWRIHVCMACCCFGRRWSTKTRTCVSHIHLLCLREGHRSSDWADFVWSIVRGWTGSYDE